MYLDLYISVVFGICSCLEIAPRANGAVKIMHTNSCLDKTMKTPREWLIRLITGPRELDLRPNASNSNLLGVNSNL
jgi:hypothetical protein